MPPTESELVATIHDWDRAMVTNNAERIGRFMADDWVIVGPDGSVDGRERFLELVRSGRLSHEVMESHDLLVRSYGEVAWVLARGLSGGRFEGAPFYLEERVSCVFRYQDGRWQCHSTHLSLIATSDTSPRAGEPVG